MIVVTGATGFIGSAVCSALAAAGRSVRAISRNPGSGLTPVGAITGTTDWSETLKGAQSIIHLAARVHLLNDRAADPVTEYRRMNVDGTINLARQAAEAGVKRFIFVSSIKVNGEETAPGQSYRPEDIPQPRDAYGVSKLEAEDGLRSLAAETGLELVIIRPPLVYGPGVKANFASMMRWLHRGLPLPFGAVKNRRSFLAVENLADLLNRCVDHPGAPNQVFLACDGEDLSTADLLRRLGDALGRPARLIPMPPALLDAAATLTGQGDLARRLLGSLQVDASKAHTVLDWKPPLAVDDALIATARAFRASEG